MGTISKITFLLNNILPHSPESKQKFLLYLEDQNDEILLKNLVLLFQEILNAQEKHNQDFLEKIKTQLKDFGINLKI